ncbi:MAG: restriction endonuclease, SacI family [Bacteroidales bacterium]
MAEKNFSPNPERASKILKELWQEVYHEPSFHVNHAIERLMNSKWVSIRYCLPTQLLGKLTDIKLDALCLQKGSADNESAWDPRSFANKVIVPWVAELVKRFLSETSGGDRGLAVAAALFETLGNIFNLYKEVRRHVINASDHATGLAADLECIGLDGKVKLAVEVKERNLTLTDIRSTILKARKVSIKEILLNAPDFNMKEKDQIDELISKTWASGTNIYQSSIEQLLTIGLTLTGEIGRIDFLKSVGDQLDNYNTQPVNRARWKELLEKL